MPSPPADIVSLRPALVARELILTANQRLARALEQSWAAEQDAIGRTAWERPRIYALEHWFNTQWERLRDAAFPPALAASPANLAVEQRLWRSVIARQPDIAHEEATGFARLALSARQLLERWDLDLTRIGSDHCGSALFASWLPLWRRAMAARALLTREQCLELLLEAHDSGVLPGAGHAHLIGFAALPPRYRRVLEQLCDRLTTHTPPRRNSVRRLVTPADADAEIAAAVDWAADYLRAHPDRRIGLVIPDLAACRDRVERLVRDALTPHHCLPSTPWSPAPCNISAGQPLSDLPLARTALTLLGLHEESLPSGCAYALLHDVYWGDPDAELEVRSRAEIELREGRAVTLGASDLRRALAHAETHLQTPALVTERLQEAAEQRRRAPRNTDFRTWARLFESYLGCLGWPGQRSLDSHEFQQRQHWQELLEHLGALAVTGETVDWGEALDELRRLAKAAPFQSRTPAGRLQILGVLEAAGLQFDALWVTNMTDSRWPEPLDPHPLLPAALQRHLAMPRAQPEHELALAQLRLQEFEGAAAEIVFSYPLRDGEVELQPYTGLRDLPATPAAEPRTHPWIPLARNATAPEIVAWGDAPPCGAGELEGGGSARLRDQSNAPFNAFAIWRLGARPLLEPEPGLSRADRGKLVHRALELFWTGLANQEQLLALDEGARAQTLRAAITGALDELARHRPELHGPRLRSVETDCLYRLLLAWLTIEMARPPFAVVAREHRVALDLAGLPIALRIDRIDRLADDRVLLLDYKTGATHSSSWDGERPEDPQLPLYALAHPEHLAGIALARIRIDPRQGCDLTGLADRELLGCKTLADAGLPDDWAQALRHWERTLGSLAREFLQGTATLCHHHPDSATRDPLIALNRLPELEDIQRIIESS